MCVKVHVCGCTGVCVWVWEQERVQVPSQVWAQYACANVHTIVEAAYGQARQLESSGSENVEAYDLKGWDDNK